MLRGNFRALRCNHVLEAPDPPLARHDTRAQRGADARAQRDALSFGTIDDASGARRGGRLNGLRVLLEGFESFALARAAPKMGSKDSGSSCVREIPSWHSEAARESSSAN